MKTSDRRLRRTGDRRSEELWRSMATEELRTRATAAYELRKQSFAQVVDALDLAQATMKKVHQNLSWAVAYNAVAIPIAAGLLLPQFDFAMTPSLSGGLMALSSIFVVTNSLLLQLHGSQRNRRKSLVHKPAPVDSIELKI